MSHFAVPADAQPYDRDLKTTHARRVGLKPVWRLEAAEDAILECAREGAGISQGQILVLEEDGLTPLPWDTGTRPPVRLTVEGPSEWRCARADGESWDDWCARSAAYAIEQTRELTAHVRFGGQRIMVDLAWVTEEELAIFDLPAFARAELDEAVAAGTRFTSFRGTSSRVRFARPVAGSFHGSPAKRIAEIPVDARLAWMSETPRDLRELTNRRQLEVFATYSLRASSLPVVGTLEGLRALSPGSIRCTTLSDLRALRRLEVLAVGVARQLKDWSVIADLPALRVLDVEQLWLDDLGPIGALTQLVGLHVCVPLAPKSLTPLAALSNLRQLRYWGGARDGSLAPLASLEKLDTLDLRTGSWKLEEFAELAAALPDTEGPHRSPFLPAAVWQTQIVRCSCGSPAAQYTLGKPSRMLCSACDVDRIGRYVAKWEIMVSSARSRRVASGLE